MPSITEGGVRPQNVYWCEEITDQDRRPVAPADPQYRLFSNTVTTFDPSPQMEPDTRMGLSRVTPHDANRMQESHELSINYDLERFPVDGTGTVLDPYAFAAQRNADNQIDATLSVLHVWETDGQITAPSTLHEYYFGNRGFAHPTGTDPGASPRRSRIETHARGMIPSEAPLPFQPGDDSVIAIESSWTGPEIRKYEFDQPIDAGETLVVRSSDAADTGVEVTVEQVDGSNQEVLTLDGTDAAANYVSTSSTMSSLRVSTDGTHVGNIEVYNDVAADGATTPEPGQLLAVIFGENEYDGIEADSGVPMLGTGGSFEDPGAVTWTPQTTIGSDVSFDGDSLGEVVTGATLTVSHDIAENNTSSGRFMDMRGTTQEITLESSFYGETDSYRTLQNHLSMREGEVRMALTDGEVVVPRLKCTDPGTPANEEGTATAVVEAVFTALEPDSGTPVQFIPDAA